MSEAKSRIAAISVEDRVLFVGGTTGQNGPGTGKVEIYDANKDEVTDEIYSTSTAGDYSVASTEKYSMFYDGVYGLVGKLHIYNHQEDSWETINHPDRKANAGVVTHRNKVYFAGGKDGSRRTNSVAIYDFDLKTWSYDSISVPRSNIATAVVNDKIYFIGGDENLARNMLSDAVDVYDTRTQTWSSFQLSEARSNIGVVVVDKYIVCAGGQNANNLVSGFSTVVDVINSDDQSNNSLTLPVRAYNLIGFGINRSAIFTGGNISLGIVINVDDMKVSSDFLNGSQRNFFTVKGVRLGNKAFFAGASGEDGDKVYIYDEPSDTWDTHLLDHARRDVAMSTVKNKILIGGGIDPDGNMQDDILIFTDTSFTTSLKPREYEWTYQLYPNPAKANVTLEFSEISQNLTYSLYGTNGTLLRSEVIPDNITKFDIKLPNQIGNSYIIKVCSKGIKNCSSQIIR